MKSCETYRYDSDCEVSMARSKSCVNFSNWEIIEEYKGIMSEDVYLIIAQYDDHERMWEVVNKRNTFQEARITKKAHEAEKDCTAIDVYVARRMTDKELEG